MTEEEIKRSRSTANDWRFFIFGPDVTGGGKGHGLVFENEDQLRSPPRLIVRPAEGGFPALSEKPRIRYDRKLGKPPRDLEGGMSGYWLVSERLKKIFEETDPEGFAFVECDYFLPDGSQGPTHYLCEVVPSLDALDLVRSKIKIKFDELPPHRKYYSILGGAALYFDNTIVGSAHVFRQSRLRTNPICDAALRNACRACSGLTGVRFRQADKL